MEQLQPCLSNSGSTDLDHVFSLSCQNCNFKDEQIKLLVEEVHLLKDMINTCQVYKQMNQSLYSNLMDACVQTELEGIDNTTHIETDKIVEVCSYMLVNSAGEIEAPSSIFSKSNQVVQSCHINEIEHPSMNSNVFCSGALSEVSSKELSVGSGNAIGMHLSDVSSELGCDSHTRPVNSTEISFVKPIEVYDECLFSQFSVHTLVEKLNFTHAFHSRSALYFGNYPYSYKGGLHEPRKIKPGSYVDKLCAYLDVVLPDFQYNSVLIHLFKNGDQSMPSHSDDESCIDDDSDIVTVSLGAERTLVLRDIVSDQVVQSVKLAHGSISRMSKASQKYYRHEIPKDPYCTEPRASLTFRLIKKPVDPFSSTKPVHRFAEDQPPSDGITPCGHVPFPESGQTVKAKKLTSEQEPRVQSPPNPKSVLYISSSMFRFIDTNKLSSPNVTATKLFYPGANASVMLNKLRKDLPLLSTKPSSIYIMCGTNNVNSIYYGSGSLEESFNQITEVLQYLHSVFPAVDINVVNILPRTTPGKNDVVRELNSLLKNYCQVKKMKFMETKHLFNTANGKRRNQYFVRPSGKIVDNCHLNEIGVSRLGKFLKYWTHSHLNT